MYAVLFDIDGTLLLTGGAGKSCFIETFREDFQIADPDGEVSFAGRSDRAIAQDLMLAHGIEPSIENWHRFQTGYCDRVQASLHRCKGALLPGVVELLDELGQREDVALGLLTGNVEHGAWAKLTHYGLADRFAFGGFGDDYTDRNDIAAAALRAAEQHAAKFMNGSPAVLRGVVVVGDTVFDVRCAKAIDAFAVGVATGSTTRDQLAESGADLVLDNLTNSKALLEILRAS